MTAYPTVVLVNHEGVVISPELTRLDDAEDGSWRFGYMGGEIDPDDSSRTRDCIPTKFITST